MLVFLLLYRPSPSSHSDTLCSEIRIVATFSSHYATLCRHSSTSSYRPFSSGRIVTPMVGVTSRASARRPRYGVSVDQRRALRQFARQHPSYTQRRYQQWFLHEYGRRLTLSTISQSLSRRFSYVDFLRAPQTNVYRQRWSHWPELDNALSAWVLQSDTGVPISGDLLREKVAQFWRRVAKHRGMEVSGFDNRWLPWCEHPYKIRPRIRHEQPAHNPHL